MELTLLKVLDETPQGLTTGFRLKLTCQAGAGEPFQLDVPILVSKDVLARRIPLPNLVVAYLKKEGLEAWPDLFVDSRRLNLEGLSAEEPALPLTLQLGGPDVLNAKALERLAARRG
ncbi:MAG: hypothetical protein M5U26_21085 [Planctomycetota bacterium]|nr:hypothetical protein [Planctomycetota bacterium]